MQQCRLNTYLAFPGSCNLPLTQLNHHHGSICKIPNVMETYFLNGTDLEADWNPPLCLINAEYFGLSSGLKIRGLRRCVVCSGSRLSLWVAVWVEYNRSAEVPMMNFKTCCYTYFGMFWGWITPPGQWIQERTHAPERSRDISGALFLEIEKVLRMVNRFSLWIEMKLKEANWRTQK